MQSPSFLDFQRTIQETQGKNNAQTLFDVFQIPTDNHIRNLLDPVESEAVYPIFDFIFDGFQRATVLGDDLYCHKPFCRALLDKRFEFTRICKPDSHKTLYEWVDDLDRNGV